MDICNYGYEKLAEAMVGRAVWDYINGLCSSNLSKTDDAIAARDVNYESAVRFLEGDELKLYTNVGGRSLMQKAWAICEECDFDFKRVKKVCALFPSDET